MAIVLPLLLMLTIGLLEYGWFFFNAHQVANAAQQGARVGTRADATSADVEETVDSLMDSAGLGDSGYELSISPSDITDLEPGEALTVEITVPYGNIELVGTLLVPTPNSVQSSMTMAREGP